VESNIYDSNLRNYGLINKIVEILNSREIIYALVTNDFRSKYKRSSLGVFWSLLNPLVTSFILWVVFESVFKPHFESSTQFAPYLLAGVLLISLFTSIVNNSAASISTHGNLIRRIFLSPSVYAFSSGITSLVNFLIGLIPLIFISILSGGHVGFRLLLLPFFVISFFTFCYGLSLALGIIYVRFDDARYLFSLLLTLNSYMIPIFYPVSILSKQLQTVVYLNPMTSFLDIFRFIILGTNTPGIYSWLYAVIISAFSLLIGSFVLNRYWRMAAMSL